MAAPSTGELLTQWNWEPSVLLGLLLLTGLYFYAVGPPRERYQWGPPLSRKQAGLFVLSQAVLIVALLSPVDAIGDRYLFSVHMVQHLLLAAVWPPFFLSSVPRWLADVVLRRPGLSAFRQFFTYPAVAIALFNLDVYLWHVPILYNMTLSNASVHILEHLTFMAFGVLNWWPVLSPIPEQRLAYPLQVLYLFADGMFMMVLGILFTFAPSAFYSAYVTAPRLWGISAGSDQQIGGLIMWYPGNLPYAALLVVSFYRWIDGGEPARPDRQSIASQSPTMGPRPH
jgi:putative membrane protein